MFDMPWWFLVLAFVMALYQAFRGWRNQVIYGNRALRFRSPSEFYFTHALSDALTYGVSTVAGFGALALAWSILEDPGVADLSGGSVALIVFLASAGLVGVVGHLPDVILDVERLRKRLGG